MKQFLVSLSAACLMNVALADVDGDVMQHMVDANAHVKNIDVVLVEIKKDTGVTALFPVIVPKEKNNQKYYASLDVSNKQSGFRYIINVDTTPECNGVKYCNVGRVSAQNNAKIEMMRDRHHRKITEKVMLADGTFAYFTPGHAMGDYFPASIQWLDRGVLYMIVWNSGAKEDMVRAELVTMANSVKHPGAG